jgi:hypothetical protein
MSYNGKHLRNAKREASAQRCTWLEYAQSSYHGDISTTTISTSARRLAPGWHGALSQPYEENLQHIV